MKHTKLYKMADIVESYGAGMLIAVGVIKLGWLSVDNNGLTWLAIGLFVVGGVFSTLLDD